MSEIKTGDYVYRKKVANDRVWESHGYGYEPMRVTGTKGGHLQFNDKAYTWSREAFERVHALQPGDIVMRKSGFRDYAGWEWGSQLHEVDSIHGNELRLKGNSFDWSIENFDLVLRRNNLSVAQASLDEATKPLHHTIELREARIRVLESEVATLKDEAGLLHSHIRRESKRAHELEDEVVQLKVELKEAEERARRYDVITDKKTLEEKIDNLQWRLTNVCKHNEGMIVDLGAYQSRERKREQQVTEMRRSIAMLRAMIETADRQFNA